MKEKSCCQIDQLICYMASSARGLLDEPASYGPFRLIDAAARLLEILEAEYPSDEELACIRLLINEKKISCDDRYGCF